MRDDDWPDYLSDYHDERPGITERALECAAQPPLGTPYDWLSAALPERLGRVLDVACGSAPLQPRLAARAKSYLGVDVSPAELALARERGRGPVVLGDARELPVAGASVDTVVVSMGLMLVRPFDAALSEIARVLRPGGRAGFLLPTSGPLRPADVRPLLALAWRLHGPGSMPQRITERRFVRAASRCGLQTVRASRHRFTFPLATRADAAGAVRSLYTPGRTDAQRRAAERALARLARPGRALPLPLLRLIATKAPDDPGIDHTGEQRRKP
ncbi:methyltransferase domain-containing protein [Isoptericola halotolerans]|uniref:class I SAM-dependent methyltransferase n=1 Tax=Isoptericola halotolerans TaxID=300560 RepID=UPI003890E4E2